MLEGMYGSRFAGNLARRATAAALLLVSQTVAAAIPESEREALIDIYTQTHGVHWANNTNWCTESPCPAEQPVFGNPGTECSGADLPRAGWYGVDCDDAQAHVVSLFLTADNLTGQLPSIKALTHLQTLMIDGNQLSGDLPDPSGMASLRYYFADMNQFTRPPAAFADLPSIVLIDISYNRLAGNLPLLDGLSSLEVFRANGNQFSGPVPSLSGAPNLFGIDIGENRLNGSLPTLEGLDHLQWFFARNNSLTGAIPPLANLPDLQMFFVAGNQLSGAIPVLPDSLEQIQIGRNRLSGAVPAGPSSLIMGASSLCPNPLDLTPSDNDAAWNLATEHSPWWAWPTPANRCDDLLFSGFEITH